MQQGKATYIDDPLDVPSDAPPAYEDVSSPGPSSQTRFISGQAGPSIEKPRVDASSGGNGSAFFHEPSTRPGSSSRKPKIIPAVASPKVQSDIQETVRGLIRSVVHDFAGGQLSLLEALGVLESCDSACIAHSLSLAPILQERSIEGRSAVYWSILSKSTIGKNPSGVDDESKDRFLSELLTKAAPLSSIGVSELRSACLAASDNSLFQRLRSIPGIVPLAGSDRMLAAGLGSTTSIDPDQLELNRRTRSIKGKEFEHAFCDLAEVQDGDSGSEGESFKVKLRLKVFQRRMRVSRAVVSEFIARGAFWPC